MILCPKCHATVDPKKAVQFYSVDVLERMKHEKELMIQRVLENLNLNECLRIKFGSSIGNHNFAINDKDIRNQCFLNGFYSKEEIINISENCNFEDTERSIRTLDDNFNSRIQRLIDNDRSPTLCLFGLARCLIGFHWEFLWQGYCRERVSRNV